MLSDSGVKGVLNLFVAVPQEAREREMPNQIVAMRFRPKTVANDG